MLGGGVQAVVGDHKKSKAGEFDLCAGYQGSEV